VIEGIADVAGDTVTSSSSRLKLRVRK